MENILFASRFDTSQHQNYVRKGGVYNLLFVFDNQVVFYDKKHPVIMSATNWYMYLYEASKTFVSYFVCSRGLG